MLKKFLIGTLAVMAVFIATTAFAADFGTTTLRVGSKGEAVKAVQTLVGASVDGSFGPMTAAKVKVWQAANGLTADGVFGNMSKAKANGAVSGNFPVGCTSATGFSSTTGVACVAIPSTVAGCASGALFSATTGASCGSVVTLPAGCVAGALFSATSGASCTGTTVVTTTGQAGSIDTATEFTSGIETIVKEARSTNVLGLEIKGSSDSDLALTNLSLDFVRSSAGSDRLERYADAISIYNGSTKVGSALATDFSRSASTSSKTIALSNVIVKAGQKVRLTVVFEAKDAIQTADLSAHMSVTASEIRYTDGTGAILFKTPSSVTQALTFQAATAYDTVTLQSSTYNPINSNLQVKTSTVSDAYLIGSFKLKAGSDSTDLSVTSIPVVLTGTDTLTGGVTTATMGDVINDIYLKVGDTVYDNYTATGTTTVANYNAIASQAATYTFAIDSGTLTLAADQSKDVKIYVKLGSQSTKYDAGFTVVPSITASTIAVENKAGDTVTSPSTPFAGSTMTLLINGASVTYVSDSYTAYDAANAVNGTISMTFSVANFGNTDVTIADSQTNNHAAGSGIIIYDVTGATEQGAAVVTSSQVIETGSNFIVSAGDTSGKTFTISQKFNTVTGFVRLALTGLDNTTVTNVQTAAH